MQKKLIALAIAGVFAAPAFAATSNVDVYGSINVSLDSVTDGSNDRYLRMVTNNNSFLGFKGSEDLGGGLSAVWQIEANINIDGNESNAKDAGNIYGTRNTYIGLSSKGMGTVVFGTHDTPYKMSTGKLDLFVGTLGDYNAIMGAAGDSWGKVNNPSSTFDLRTGNTIAYMSPNFGGFDFKAAYVMGLEGAEAVGAKRSNAYSLSGTYANGPLFVTAAYEKHNDVDFVSSGPSTFGSCNPGAVCLGSGTGGYDRDAWKIGVGYTLGAFQVGAMYESQDDNGWIAHDSWMINGAYTMGNMKFKAEYLRAGDLDWANDTGASMWAIGMDYAMSKRTTVQLTYAKINNDDIGVWQLGQGAVVSQGSGGSTVYDDPSGFSIGVKHTF